MEQKRRKLREELKKKNPLDKVCLVSCSTSWMTKSQNTKSSKT